MTIQVEILQFLHYNPSQSVTTRSVNHHQWCNKECPSGQGVKAADFNVFHCSAVVSVRGQT